MVICERTDLFFLFFCFFCFLIESCWLPCLRELTVPRMLLSHDWGPTKWDTKSRSVPVSTCMLKHLLCAQSVLLNVALEPPQKPRGGGIPSPENTCLHLFLYLLTVSPTPLQVQSKRFKKILKVVHLGIYGETGWAAWPVKLASTKRWRTCRVLALWRAVVECVSVLMITYRFFFFSFCFCFFFCFLVRINWTFQNDFFV